MAGKNRGSAKKRDARLEHEAAERAASERRGRLKMLAGVAGLIVVFAVIAVASGAFKGNDPAADASEVSGVRGVSETRRLIGKLPQRGTLLGNPNAPVTIHEFADLKCPACQAFELTQQQQTIDELVRTGKANMRIHLINIIDPNVGTTDGALARTAAHNLVASNRYWSFLSTVYYNQGQENESWITEPGLRRLAAQAPGVGAADINARATPASRALDANADALSKRLGVRGTPSFYVQPRGTNRYLPVQEPTADSIASAVSSSKKALLSAPR